jgi:glycosyltransferase involved in cell wall biosynthesis
MRIGFDAKRAYHNNTGLGNYSRSVINALCRLYAGNDYLLYTPSTGKNKIYTHPEDANIGLPPAHWFGPLKNYWRSFGLGQRLKKDQIDLFHGLSNEIPSGLHKTGVKSVVTIHDLIFMRLPRLYHPLDRYIYEKKVRNAIKTADKIIAISRQTRDDLVELFKADERKIRIIYQGCNPWFYEKVTEEIKSEIRKKYELPDKYLLYIGTIEERKDLLSIIRAIHEHRINIPLVAVGKRTAYYSMVKKYIEKHGIVNVLFYHHIENRDLPSIYQQAEAFIYPSHYEGFGIPVLEALNSGIPVITSRGGCLEETAGNGGLFVDPGNAEQLADAIRSVTENPEVRQKLVKEGSKHALLFREERTIPDLIDLYKECLQ